jgi:hypothetical protein
MKSIINMLLLIAAVIIVLILTGVISQDDLLDMLGGVEEGETTQSYEEGEFQKAFDMIVGRVEVNDTSTTEYKRDVMFCNPGYLTHITSDTIQYQVLTTPETYYFNGKKKEYYISPDLDVTYVEVGKNTKMDVKESNCVKKRNLTPDDINSSKRKAEAALKKAIENSAKIKNARTEFEGIKARLIQQFEDAGFTEVLPPSPEEEITIPDEVEKPVAH